MVTEVKVTVPANLYKFKIESEDKNDNILTPKKNRKYPDIINKKVLNTHENLKYLLKLYDIKVRYNMMLRTREVIVPKNENFIDEEENSALAKIYHIATINNMPNTKIDDHLNTIAWENSYHPIVEYLAEDEWDGISRLDDFIKCIKTKNDEKSHKIIKRWMISAIAAIFKKDFAAQGVLVLQGDQGIGKTSWVKSLDPINCRAIKEGLMLDPSDKDSVIRATSCWIGELSELDGTFKKSDIAPLKSFITSSVDILRFPYARKNSQLYRRSVYAATVNDANFLVDDTGNRRWWTIEVESINLLHDFDMKQIWSEVYNLYIIGEKYWLEKEEENIVKEENIKHQILDPFVEKINTWYDFKSSARRWVTATEVLEEIGYLKPTRSDATRMGAILKKMEHIISKISRGFSMYNFPFKINRSILNNITDSGGPEL